jgi:hypothetical protein
MEGNRLNSRVVINDSIYDKISEIRYKKHLLAIDELKSAKSVVNSCYFNQKADISKQINKYRVASDKSR